MGPPKCKLPPIFVWGYPVGVVLSLLSLPAEPFEGRSRLCGWCLLIVHLKSRRRPLIVVLRPLPLAKKKRQGLYTSDALL